MFGKRRKKEKSSSEKEKDVSRALLLNGANVGFRNPMSRGQGVSGANKVALMQMLRDE